MKNTHKPQTGFKNKKSQAIVPTDTIASLDKASTTPEATEESAYSLKASIKAFYMALKR